MALKIQLADRLENLVLQTRDVSISDEYRMQLGFSVAARAMHVEIEYTDAVARLALVDAAVTRPNHDAIAALFFATDIDHGVSDRRVALDRIRAGPEENIARPQIVELV